ncbi:ABC transporter permease [Desulfothermobacter acidiphilus]|uniref:ABC transporter permease n=1 Tax=Desulfothermobacter acidiphilus TaxID=1938353 RepID=UPI003F8B14B1
MSPVLTLAFYEFRHLLKDRVLFLIVFVAPLFYLGLFGLVYRSAVLEGIPLVVVDLDHSQLSRSLSEACAHSPHFRLVALTDDPRELEQALRENRARAGIVIPEHFARDVEQKRLARALAVYDGSNLIWGYNARKYLREVFNHFATDYATGHLEAKGLAPREIRAALEAVDLNVEPWYNPIFSYLDFLFPGLLLMIVHQLTLLAVGLTLTREKERGCWVHFLGSALPPWKIFLGKTLVYLVTASWNYTLLLWLAAWLLDLKIWGSPWPLALLGFLLALALTGGGYLISSLAPNSLQATRFITLLSVPLFIISGFTWPASQMPPGLVFLARLLPYTWAALAFRLAAIKELGVENLWPYFSPLAAIAFTLAFLAAQVKIGRRS